jgi:hypothetical protein
MNALVACDVFLEEIEAFEQSEELSLTPKVWLEMGLHDRPVELRHTIGAHIAKLDAGHNVDNIILAYGLCGNGLLGIKSGRIPLILPKAHDCISVLLGGIEPHTAILKQHPATYFYSPGWVRGRRVPGPDREAHLRALFAEKYADDPEMIDELIEVDGEVFAHHDTAAYVDLTNNKPAEDYCRNCARHLGWDFVRLQGDRSLLRQLLTGPWPDDRFLTVQPGEEVCLSNDGLLAARVSS